MIKVYLILGAMFLTTILGWTARGWYEDSQEKKVIVDKVEDHNEDTEELAEHSKVIEKERIVYREKIVRVPAADVSGGCPIDELTRVRNEAYGSLPDMYFQSSD